MRRRVLLALLDVVEWLDALILHPLHDLHPRVAEELLCRVCYPIERARLSGLHHGGQAEGMMEMADGQRRTVGEHILDALERDPDLYGHLKAAWAEEGMDFDVSLARYRAERAARDARKGEGEGADGGARA